MSKGAFIEDFNAHNKYLTAKLLKQAFSKFYRRYYELISKFNVGLKSLLHQGISQPEFYGDLVHVYTNSKRLWVEKSVSKIIICHKRIGYDLNVVRQSACLVINQITVDNVAALFN